MIKAELKKVILDAAKDYGVKSGDIVIEEPRAERFGDFATSIALKIAKNYEENPQRIAKDIVGKIKFAKSRMAGKSEMIEKVEVAGPGFINFFLSRKYLQGGVARILKEGNDFGSNEMGKGKKIQVEFISANPTGPLTLGNGRGGFMGDTLASVLEACGYKIDREYYINDIGNQIKALGEAVLEKGDQYKGDYIKDLSGKIKGKTSKVAGKEAAEIIIKEMIKPAISKTGIEFNNFVRESDLYEKGKVLEVIEYLKSKDLTYGKDGALWFRSQKLGDDKDRVLKRKDGQFTYFASDIAYHLDKFDRGFDRVIDFWGADHFGYVDRLKLSLSVLGFKDKLDIIIVQLVRLVEGGKEVKMSKREGVYVTLEELIDKVGLDVVRFFFLMNAANTHMDFDLRLAREKSQKNPVYYCQYAYARIQSILAKIKSQKLNLKIMEADLSKLNKKKELGLIKELVKYPDLVADIAVDYQVQGLPFYVMKLADSFHKFYENHKVISKDKKLTAARLALIRATSQVLKNCLGLMGVSAPEKM